MLIFCSSISSALYFLFHSSIYLLSLLISSSYCSFTLIWFSLSSSSCAFSYFVHLTMYSWVFIFYFRSCCKINIFFRILLISNFRIEPYSLIFFLFLYLFLFFRISISYSSPYFFSSYSATWVSIFCISLLIYSTYFPLNAIFMVDFYFL